jgi:BirA family biotin operon repressor/biotin-[acetyl-CoA-carboxylase] ligase
MALATVDSTNAEAARQAGARSSPLWILANEQTGGRGRRGRPWSSPPGNFHATLLLYPAEPPDVVALRSFVAALALRDACVALTGLPGAFTLKWPNDVLLNGGTISTLASVVMVPAVPSNCTASTPRAASFAASPSDAVSDSV